MKGQAQRMGSVSKLPRGVAAPLVEWKAQHIRDPIQRLRYLQQVACTRSRRQRIAGWSRRNWHFAAGALALAVTLLLPLLSKTEAHVTPHGTKASVAIAAAGDSAPVPDVWRVETAGSYEVYSNGLRIDNQYVTANEPRSYVVFPLKGGTNPLPEERTVPGGIVYHTTESNQAPFEPEQNRRLQRIGESLLDYVRHNRSYNFVIDRFGRVFRVVQETDVANHAGISVWADSRFLYLNLNHSFLGVAFEAQSAPGGGQQPVTEAQVRAGRVLTEMLRSRYGISGMNCVAHAQVSVNPSNMRIGYHQDWASNFPFQAMGLADNYVRPLPSLYAFGFGYDPSFLNTAGAHLRKGLELAEEQVRRDAAAQHLTPTAYVASLQKRYRQMYSALKTNSAEENN